MDLLYRKESGGYPISLCCLFSELKEHFDKMLMINEAAVKEAIVNLNALISQQLVAPPDYTE